MRKEQVSLGKVYIVKVSGSLQRVRINRVSPYGGWYGTNIRTAREVRIYTAGKLRKEVSE